MEMPVLEKLGVRREGVLREYGWKDGRSWDYALYARLAPSAPEVTAGRADPGA